jgi:hypothetical protein
VGARLFVFHDRSDGAAPVLDEAEKHLRRVADAGGGALLPFDSAAPDQVRALLAAIGAYAAGGLAALRTADRKRLPGAPLLLRYLAQ